MSKWVSTNEKKAFLLWFLENHRLKKADARRLLEVLIKNFHLLENVHFTDELRPTRRTVVISSINSDEIGFKYYQSGRVYEEVAVAYSEIMNNPTEPVYLLIHFYGKLNNHRYLQLIENKAIDNIRRYEYYEKVAKKADQIIEQSLVQNQKEMLLRQIDKALDEKNEELFKQLVQQLQNDE
ncbi:YpiB family protein [Alkalihalobacterium alkalinitrilicum]|uniref:YpiB family protein n=1 Tax=Alkalihalobacterium alkalinitrilicum TaxID=427920 RepID=UPI0009951378|nr:YpiB family protein [Alkalihalobacterium alkalinitrilicum]